MNTSLYIRSLVPGTAVYMWTSDGSWTTVPADTKTPPPWLANQAGLLVSAISAINVDSWLSLLSGLEVVHKDVVFDAQEAWKETTYRRIHVKRWEKLSAPRPTLGDMPGEPLLIATQHGGVTYGLSLGKKGYGGWYELSDVPDLSDKKHFELWDYTVYIMQEPVSLTCGEIKRAICATFDCLLTYSSDFTEAKQYLAYATPLMKEMWERRNTKNGENGS